MSELARAVALSGAIDADMMREFEKWRLPLTVPDENDSPFTSPEEACEAIDAAIEGPDQVELKTTDLDVLRDFARTRAEGRLFIVKDDKPQSYRITFGRNSFGHYLIPWGSDSLVEVLTNGQSYILDGNSKVFLSDVKDLYFGSEKRFIACVPSKVE